MILACSARALERIEKAKRSRIAKKDPVPMVVKDKRQVARIRAWLNERAGYEELVWNLDVNDYSVGGSDGELAGYFTCGYVFSGHFRLAAILNALDDADLCAIGALARRGIEVVSQDCYATPMACSQLLDDAEELALELFRFLQDERIIDWLDVARAGWPSPTIVIPNGNRSAAIGLSHVVEMHAGMVAKSPIPLSERPDIDRSECYRINGMPVTIRATGKKDYQFPDLFWRASLSERFGHVRYPAVRLRVKLLDGFAPGAHREPPAFEPTCYRDLLLPLDAPLSWVHQVIQKAFYWADYHLHEFQFLDSDARELLDGAFRDLLAIEPFMDDRENPFTEPDGEKRFVQASNMSLRWLYHDFAETAEREGMLDNDFPSAQLPENQPLGLFLLGSAGYPRVMAALQDGKRPEAPISKSQGLYYRYDYGSDKELSLFPLEYSMEDAYDLPHIVGAIGHTPPEDSGMSEYREIVEMIEGDGEAAAVACKSHHAFNDDEKERFHLLHWARRNGWRPFTSLEDLDGFFGRHTGMGW